MTPTDLRKLAEAATPGPWVQRWIDDPHTGEEQNGGDKEVLHLATATRVATCEESAVSPSLHAHNAAFIAACSPHLIKRLADLWAAAQAWKANGRYSFPGDDMLLALSALAAAVDGSGVK